MDQRAGPTGQWAVLMNQWPGALDHHYSLISTSEGNVKSEGRKEGVAEAHQHTTVRGQLVVLPKAGQGRAGAQDSGRGRARAG